MSYDVDMPSVYSCEMRTAKKAHRCCECQNEIHVGDRYQFFKGCYGGKWKHFKTCQECSDLRDMMAREDEDRISPPFGELMEWARESGYAQQDEVTP